MRDKNLLHTVSMRLTNLQGVMIMHYGMGGGCGYGYTAPYAYPGFGYNNWFALIVVLFILLIIIGASCYGK